MKNRFIIVFGLLLLGCNNKVNQNFEDLKRVKKGMSYQEVKAIMKNHPIKIDTFYLNRIENDKIVGYQVDTVFATSYESPAIASDDYRIFFSVKDSTVVKINYGD